MKRIAWVLLFVGGCGVPDDQVVRIDPVGVARADGVTVVVSRDDRAASDDPWVGIELWRSDGGAWEQVHAEPVDAPAVIARGEGMFLVAVLDPTGDGLLLESADGTDWEEVDHAGGEVVGVLACDDQLLVTTSGGVILARGASGAFDVAWAETDIVHPVAACTADGLLVHDPHQAVLVGGDGAVTALELPLAEGGRLARFAATADDLVGWYTAQAWRESTTEPPDARLVRRAPDGSWADEGELFVPERVATDATTFIALVDDALYATTRPGGGWRPSDIEGTTALAWGDGLFLAAGTYDLWTSVDGETWGRDESWPSL